MTLSRFLDRACQSFPLREQLFGRLHNVHIAGTGKSLGASASVGPFSCARWQRYHIRNAPFVLTQYGWFLLSQRSDA